MRIAPIALALVVMLAGCDSTDSAPNAAGPASGAPTPAPATPGPAPTGVGGKKVETNTKKAPIRPAD